MNKTTWLVRAVIFDMDGVITHTMPQHFRAWHKILKAAGLSVNRHDIYKREGQRGITSVQEIFSEKGRTISPAQARRLLRQKENLFRKNVSRKFIRGARRFIKSLKRQGIPLGLVTGTSRKEMHKILPEYLLNKFDVIITGDDTSRGKPHPDPYRRILKQMRIPADRTTVIENAPLGICSAKSAGCRCLALTTSLAKKYLNEADRVFDSFQTLNRYLRFIPDSDGHKPIHLR